MDETPFPRGGSLDGWILDLSRGGGGVLSSFGEFLRESGREGKKVLRIVLSSFCEQLYGGKTRFELIIIHGGNNLYAR